jgi:4-amino-4-deoxy-L-arabinose transferase-like glycosyltransferase
MKESGFSILWPVKIQDYTVANFIYTHSFLCFLIGISFFWGLSSYGLLDINDGLYTSIARDMLENRQWTVPHLNSVPYLEKPPVLYYLLAGSFFLFGVNEFAARLPVVLSGLSVCMLAYWLGYRLNRKVCGFLAALILSSSPVFIIVSRTIYFDMVLTLMQSAAIILFYLYWKDKKLYLLRLAYIFLALAVMVKGFMSIAFLILIFTCFILLKRIHFSRVFIFFKDPVSIILFFIISVPWHVAAYTMQPDFFSFYIINENIYRFLGIREPYDYHTGPIWYYIPRWFLYYFPWSLSLPFFLLHFFKKIKIGDDTLFLIVWFTVLFIIFSISSNKGDYYLIKCSRETDFKF